MKKLPLGVKTGLSFGHARGAEGGARHRRYCLSGAPARSCESAQSCHSAQDRQSAAVMKSTQVKSGPFGHNQTAGTAPGSTPLSTNEAGQPQIEMSGRGQYHNNILQDTGHDTERDPLPLPSTIGVRALGVVTKNSLLVAVDTLVEEGSLDEALELLSETSTFPGISPTEKALALQKEAAILIEQKRLDEAYQKIVAVLDNAEHGPKIRAVALHNRGQYRWRISDVTGAIRDYLQSGRTKEAHPNTRIASYTNAAWLLIRERNFKEAINCCKEGLGLSPDDIALLSNLGFALLLAGQKKRAIKVYTRLWSRTTSLQQLERAGASDIRLLLECCPDTPGIHEAAAILGRRRDVLRESSGPKTLDDLLIAIQTLIDIEETTEAREILRDNLSYPPTFDVGNHLPQLTPLLEQLLRNELSKESRRMLGIVARNSNDPELYITLSELLLRDGLHGYAASILLGSHNRYPDRSNLVEPLMAALEHAGRSDEIIFFAETQGLHNLPHRAQVTYAVHQLLLGMLEQSRGTLQNITTVSDPISEDAHGEGALRDDYARLMRMLMRAEAVAQRPPTLLAPLTPDDIRGWSFVTSGSLLLHRSPHEPDMMRGRYAVAHDNALLVAECVQKAVAIFQGPLPRPNKILVLDQHGAMLLGSLLSHRLGVPLETYTPTSLNFTQPISPADSGSTLLIAYSFTYLPAELIEALHHRSDQQLLWVHAAQHSTHGLPAPDLISFWCRELLPIWENTLLPAPHGETTRTKHPHLSRGELIRAVQEVNRNDVTLADLEEILAIGEIATSLGHIPARGEQLWAASPVVSRER